MFYWQHLSFFPLLRIPVNLWFNLKVTGHFNGKCLSTLTLWCKQPKHAFLYNLTDNPDFIFNNNIVYKTPSQMHLRLIIDDKLQA